MQIKLNKKISNLRAENIFQHSATKLWLLKISIYLYWKGDLNVVFHVIHLNTRTKLKPGSVKDRHKLGLNKYILYK